METSYREFLRRREQSAVRRLETGEFPRPADRAYAEYQVRAYRDAAAYDRYAEHVQVVASRLLGELGAAMSRRAISPALYAACEKLLKEVR